MLGQARPLASLSSTLLARKGQARPAMRPQGFGGSFDMGGATDRPAAALEDLGWNDMGSEPTPITPAVVPAAEAPPPPVLAAREALREEIEGVEAPRAVKTVSIATAGRLQRETAHQGRAAFTLRLDAPRHLRLRLASAVTHRSAQQLVAHALDRLLETLPEIDTLVAQLPATPPVKRKR